MNASKGLGWAEAMKFENRPNPYPFFEELRKTQDPITKLRERLKLSDEEFEEADREAVELVEASVEFAKNGTDPKPEDALKNVYA